MDKEIAIKYFEIKLLEIDESYKKCAQEIEEIKKLLENKVKISSELQTRLYEIKTALSCIRKLVD